MMEQRTEDWYKARLGKVTASRISDVIAKTKTGWGASRANYMAELVAERLTGRTAERYTNSAMDWGTEMEPEARTLYAMLMNTPVEEVGFVPHPTIPMTGASPDGLIGTDGLVEIKCPYTATHIETLLSNEVPGKHIAQMQWQMACTGRKWCDFFSFDPRMPEHMMMFVTRIERDEAQVLELEKAVREFLRELEIKVARLQAIYEPVKNILQED